MKESIDLRHQARRAALQTLFGWSFLSKEPKEILAELEEQLCDEESKSLLIKLKASSQAWKLCQTVIEGVIKNKEKIDKMVANAAPEWPLGQIPKLDLTILRMAIFELLEKLETPPKVAIDEAVELAKEFGSDKSPKFVNGVLGTVLKNLTKK